MILSWHLVSGLSGCPRERGTTDAGSSVPDTIKSLQVREERGFLLTFFDNRAEMLTVERVDQVDPAARFSVMVTDPTSRLKGDLVYVADLRKKLDDGTFKVWVESRSGWLDRVMPKQSMLDQASAALARSKPEPSAKPRRIRRPVRLGRAVKGARGHFALDSKKISSNEKKKVSPGHEVILFSTSWCPACTRARQYFHSRGIPFADLDVQQDKQAAQSYRLVQQRFGLKPGMVPVIIVNDRVFGGFSLPHIEAALATGPPRPK